MSTPVAVVPLNAIDRPAASAGWGAGEEPFSTTASFGTNPAAWNLSPPPVPLNGFAGESPTLEPLSALDLSGALNDVGPLPSTGVAAPAFVPDVALPDSESIGLAPVAPEKLRNSSADIFSEFLARSTQAFSAAQKSEAAVIHGHGSILDMSVDRARADALLGVVATGAARFSSMLQTFMNMAV